MSESKIPLKVELGASLRVEAKIEIPKESTGRLVDALTDMIRPLSEYMGLKGDQIRLQRVETAIETVRRAHDFLRSEQRTPIPAPLKVLVPLLEFASNEDIEDDFMIDSWAQLLVSSTRPGSVPPKFVNILSELNGRQARLLLTLYRWRGGAAADEVRAFKFDGSEGSFNQLRRLVPGLYQLTTQSMQTGVPDTDLDDFLILQSLMLTHSESLHWECQGQVLEMETMDTTRLGQSLLFSVSR